MVKEPRIMLEPPRIMLKAPRIMVKAPRIMRKAPNKMPFDHLRQLAMAFHTYVLCVMILITDQRILISYHTTWFLTK